MTHASLNFVLIAVAVLLTALSPAPAAADAVGEDRMRARDLGVAPGILAAGPLNAITDVEGVRVGHVTLVKGRDIRTGATVILPHGGNLYQDKVPGAVFVGNGFGKLMGSTQVKELGEIETPIVLTNTLNVAEGAIAAIEWTLDQPGNERVRSVNAVVGETNDAGLNNIRKRAVTAKMIRKAIESATPGPVEEGAVGAGTGTRAFGWKGGVGTSSRRLPDALGGYTLGVLVQTNYGGVLAVDGVPVGKALGRYFLEDYADNGDADGSIMVVVATDAPLSDRNLERLAMRAMIGVGRTGASMTNGSGDYAIAFSTAESVRRAPARRNAVSMVEELPNNLFSPLSQAVIEATEEAILNSLFMATTMEGYDTATGAPSRVEALPLDAVRALVATRPGAAVRLRNAVAQRLALMEDVAQYKYVNRLAVSDPEREAVVLERTTERARALGLDVDAAARLVTAQMTAAKAHQSARINAWAEQNAAFDSAPDLQSELRPKISAATDRLIEAALAHKAYLENCEGYAQLARPPEAFADDASKAAWRVAVDGLYEIDCTMSEPA